MELNIEVSAIVGTSIGSVNGALFAQGDFDKALELWEKIEITDVLDLSPDLISGYNLFSHKNLIPLVQELIRKNGLQTMPFQRTLESVIDEQKLRNSNINYGLNFTSLSDIESVELFLSDIRQGTLIDCIMASSCFPGFQKRYIDDKEYSDGGIMNNLPLDMLVKDGYKNIIAVDVGGVGIVKKNNIFDTNIINIRCTKPLLGIFDFDKEKIANTIKQSYYDAYRAFGRLVGNQYYFNTVDYYKAKSKYSDDLLTGIEVAADAFGIDPLAVYRVDSLIDGIVLKYHKLKEAADLSGSSADSLINFKNDNKTLIVKLTNLILNNKSDSLGNKLITGILGNRLLAAGAIAYFVNNN